VIPIASSRSDERSPAIVRRTSAENRFLSGHLELSVILILSILRKELLAKVHLWKNDSDRNVDTRVERKVVQGASEDRCFYVASLA